MAHGRVVDHGMIAIAALFMELIEEGRAATSSPRLVLRQPAAGRRVATRRRRGGAVRAVRAAAGTIATSACGQRQPLRRLPSGLRFQGGSRLQPRSKESDRVLDLVSCPNGS